MLLRAKFVLLVTLSVAVTSASAQRHWQRPDRGQQQGQQQGQRGNPSPQSPGFGQPGNRDRNDRPGPSASKPPDNGGMRTGPRSGDWLRRHITAPPQDQQRDLENDPTFRALSPDQQDRLRERLQKFNTLPPDRRERIVQRMEAWDRMSPDQKDRARDLFQRFRSVPDDRRKAMGSALRNLRNVPPDQRQQMLDSPQFRGSFSDDERNIMRGMTDLNMGPSRHGDESNSSPDNGPQF